MQNTVTNLVKSFLNPEIIDTEKQQLLNMLRKEDENNNGSAIWKAIQKTTPSLKLKLGLSHQVLNSRESTYNILAVSKGREYYFSRGGRPLARAYWQHYSTDPSKLDTLSFTSIKDEIKAAMSYLKIVGTDAKLLRDCYNIFTYLKEFVRTHATLIPNIQTGSPTQVSTIKKPNELLAQTITKIKSTNLTEIPSFLFLFLDDQFLQFIDSKEAARVLLSMAAVTSRINISHIRSVTASLRTRPAVHMPTSQSKTDMKNLLCLMTNNDEPEGIKMIRSFFYYKTQQITVVTATAYKADEGTIILLPPSHARTTGTGNNLSLNVHQLLDADVVRQFHPDIKKLMNIVRSKRKQNVFVNNTNRHDGVTAFLLEAIKQVREAVGEQNQNGRLNVFYEKLENDVNIRMNNLKKTYLAVAVKTPRKPPTRIDIKRAFLDIKSTLKDLFIMPKNNSTNRQFVKRRNNQIELSGDYPSNREWDYFGAFIENLHSNDAGISMKLGVLKFQHEVFVKGILTLIKNTLQQMENMENSARVNISIQRLIKFLENVNFFEYPLKEYYSAHSPLLENTVYLQEFGLIFPIHLASLRTAISEKTQTLNYSFTEHNANDASIASIPGANHPSPEINAAGLLPEYNGVVQVAKHRYKLLKENFLN